MRTFVQDSKNFFRAGSDWHSRASGKKKKI
nr:MAG TPA: hypothetical protein [Caudoviricetes sp.]